MERIHTLTSVLLCARSHLLRGNLTRSHHQSIGKTFIRSKRCCLKSLKCAGLCPRTHYERRLEFHTAPLANAGKIKNTKNKQLKPIVFKQKSHKDVVPIHHNMTVQELADALGKSTDHVFETFLFIRGSERYDGPDVSIDDISVIKEVVKKSGMKFKFEEKRKEKEKENKDATKRPPAAPELLETRPPVVTIMGHVDHGKTTLLDAIRHSSIVDSEFGGITQHIGAFSVSMPSGESVTYLDTPGHAAFHAMRARGANVTDIVVLVVAADDGVMKQTIESITLAKEANVPIIVAINKIDKQAADIERTKQSLVKCGLELEDFGGDIQAVPLSALTGTNLDKLQEAILAQAELMELCADPKGLVEGAVIESSTDIGRGKLCTLLVQRGTLRKGSVLVSGTAWAKVRGMFNDRGQPVTEVPPGQPVEVIGWRDLPHAGQEVLEVELERRAHEVVAWRRDVEKQVHASQAAEVARARLEEHQRLYREARKERLAQGHRMSAIARRTRTKEAVEQTQGPELSVVIKGDVDGSVEAILEVLDTYDSHQCHLHILSYAVGPVADHDVDMASNFNGIVYAFNVTTTNSALSRAKAKGVDIRQHNVIYKMIDDLRSELSQRLTPETKEFDIGEANVLEIFMVTEKNHKYPVAGCRCIKGHLSRKKFFKLIRDEDVLFDGELSSLRHFKNEVETVKTDVECGVMFRDHSIVPRPGDRVICYETREVQQQLEWDLDF